MNLRFCIATIFVALALGGTASAATWMFVAQLDEDGGQLVIDVDGIARVNKLRKAWFKFENAKVERIPAAAPRTDPNELFYSVSLELKYFNCTERTMASAQAIYRSGAGEVVAGFTVKVLDMSWSEVAPETVGEEMLKLVCGWTFAPMAPPPPPPALKRKTPAELREAS
jgi:hypothetical protein